MPNKGLNIDDEIHLPFGLQHQILRTVLRASEDCCHDWCATYAPSILEQNGWFHHKLGEMQKSRWFHAIVDEYILLGQGPGHDLEFLFDSAENVCHSYVHRDKGIPLRAFKNRIRQAVGLLQALRDYERAESVKRILKSLTRFSDHASQGGYFRELPIADQKLRQGVLSTFSDYYGDVIGFITGRNELPQNYLLMDA